MARGDASDEDVLRYIQWHWRNLGYPPSIRTIGEAVGWSSSSSVHQSILRLEKRGFIQREGRTKVIRITPGLAPELCDHDYRAKSSKANRHNEIKVVCILCWHETAKEYLPDPEDPKTWLRFVEYHS